MPGVPGQLLDQVQQHPPHRPVVDVLREPRHVMGHRHRRVQVGLGEHPQGLGVLRRQVREQPGQRLVLAHHVLVLVFGHQFRHRPGIRRGAGRRVLGAFGPSLLAEGDVLDQPADGQRADRRRGARLLVGEAVGHAEEGVLLEGQEVDQGLALAGGGIGHSGHV